MNCYLFSLLVVCAVICCIGVASAGPYGVDCRCVCCFPSNGDECTEIDIGDVHLNEPLCDDKKCFDACDKQYPNCEGWHGKLNSTCSDSTLNPSSSSTFSTDETTDSPNITITQSTSSTTVTTSSTNSSKSIFQLSHFIFLTISLIFLCS